MKFPKHILILLMLISGAQGVSAMPVLSFDKSTLSGLEVDGEIYTVRFQDGPLNTIYNPSTVATAEWGLFIPKLSQALNASFQSLNLDGSGISIAGCSGVGMCMVYIPTSADTTTFTATNMPFYYQTLTPEDPPPSLSLGLDYDSVASSALTLATFERTENPTPVPLPVSPSLLAIAIIMLTLIHRDLYWRQRKKIGSSNNVLFLP
ncbi:MAG: hypothetical protein KA343_11985 [Nitrosomonas sp.]|nr:hypothetical protein [Nitrosomonas sp.]